MTDDASAADQSSVGDTSAGGATSALPDNEANPPGDDKTSERQETPAKGSRHTEWIAVLAAVIAAAAAITGTVVGALNVHSQTHASAILAERKERMDAYAKFLTDVENLDEADFQVGNYILAAHQLAPDQMKQYSDAYREWAREDDIVSLIDSHAVDTERGKVVAAENRLYKMIPDTPNTFVVLSPEYGKDYQDADNSMFDFRTASRDDLNALGYGEPTSNQKSWLERMVGAL